MCDPILVTVFKMRPHYSQSSRKNVTPSSGTSPLASYKEVPPSRDGLKVVLFLTSYTFLDESNRTFSDENKSSSIEFNQTIKLDCWKSSNKIERNQMFDFQRFDWTVENKLSRLFFCAWKNRLFLLVVFVIAVLCDSLNWSLPKN